MSKKWTVTFRKRGKLKKEIVYATNEKQAILNASIVHSIEKEDIVNAREGDHT